MEWLNRSKRSRFSLIFTLLLLSIGATSSQAEDAAVYFYTAGSLMTTGLPGSKHGLFRGYIYDGQQRLGFIRHGNYLAIQLAPGIHNLSASLSSKHPAENSHTAILFEADKTYFIRAQTESQGILVVEFEKGRLDQVTCSTARDEAEDPKLVEDKHVPPEIRGRVIRATTWPPCQ